uniref:Uncharacterized protein n=1 Tax=Anguilla anguilla TaxID=7936 RepID=A0A0E9PBQ8_ANGAN
MVPCWSLAFLFIHNCAHKNFI